VAHEASQIWTEIGSPMVQHVNKFISQTQEKK